MNNTIKLKTIVDTFNNFWGVYDLDMDPTMSFFIPKVYEQIGFDWKIFFEKDFVTRFNGLMIKGQENVSKIWCITFPSDEVLKIIINKSNEGDLIFSHHPINMECGDPKGENGKGFLPINVNLLKEIKRKKISFYTCHAPLDTNEKISTSGAILTAISGKEILRFLKYGNGFGGIFCEIPEIKTSELINNLKNILCLPYVDLVGVKERVIKKVAIIAGGGGDLEFMEEADKLHADCLIAGEVTAKINSPYSLGEAEKIKNYLPNTTMSIIGISHAGSEYIAIRDQVVPFIKKNLKIETEAISESNWWR